MVDPKKHILLIAALLLLFAVMAGAVEFYKFPQVPDLQPRDIYMVRRPAQAGFSNATGTRNITGASLRAVFMTRSAATRKVNYTDLAAVATSGSWTDILFKPTIPTACVDIFDGAPGATGAAGAAGIAGKPALFCNLSGGTHSHTYDSYGLNPLPLATAFAVQIWDGATRVAAQTWQWWTGGSAQRIYGSGTAATFTPSVKPAFSNVSGNNYVAVQVKYSTASYGRRYCVTGTPVAVSRTGNKGDTGSAGSPDTGDQIRAKIAIAVDGAILTMQRGPSEASIAAKINVKDAAGNTRNYIDGAGYQFFKDVNGYSRVTVDTAGTITIRDANNKLRLTIDTYGQIVAYRGDGTTKSFQHYSTSLVL